jgi:hypothetical protein
MRESQRRREEVAGGLGALVLVLLLCLVGLPVKGHYVSACGSNLFGELGNGTVGGTSVFLQKIAAPPVMLDVQAISAGEDISLFLVNGSVYGCGDNEEWCRALGIASGPLYPTPPVLIPNLTAAAAISAGQDHALVMVHIPHQPFSLHMMPEHYAVMGFGTNRSGQLGLGFTSWPPVAPPVVVPMPNIPGVWPKAVAAGCKYSLVLLTNGTVYSFGKNDVGQLGLGPTNTSPMVVTPTLIPGLTNVVAIAAGGAHSLFLLANGTVYACGRNVTGQLGLGSTNTSPMVVTPTLIPGLTNVKRIAAGISHSLVVGCVSSLCSVFSFGSNSYGQLGLGPTGTANFYSTPQPVLGSLFTYGVTAISAGDRHSLVLRDGQVFSCGADDLGQLGTTGGASDTFTLMQGFTPADIYQGGVTAISAGWVHNLVLFHPLL